MGKIGRVRRLLLMAVFSSVVLASCADMGNGPAPTQPLPGDPPISFQATVAPVLQARCSGCHGGSGGFYVATVDSLKSTGAHAPNVIPGDGAGSNLIKKLMASPPFGNRMPMGGPYLSAEIIDSIRKWIDQGAKDN